MKTEIIGNREEELLMLRMEGSANLSRVYDGFCDYYYLVDLICEPGRWPESQGDVILEAHVWHVSNGGWVTRHEQLMTPETPGAFFNVGPSLSIGRHPVRRQDRQNGPIPAWIVFTLRYTSRVQQTGRSTPVRTLVKVLPVARDAGIEWRAQEDRPAMARVRPRFDPVWGMEESPLGFVAVVEPVDAVDLVEPAAPGSGTNFRVRRYVLVSTEILNWFAYSQIAEALANGGPRVQFRATVRDGVTGAVVGERKSVANGVWQVTPIISEDKRRSKIFFKVPVPKNFTYGNVTVRFTYGRDRFLETTRRSALVNGPRLHSPFTADFFALNPGWHLYANNAPGAETLNGHNGGGGGGRYLVDYVLLDPSGQNHSGSIDPGAIIPERYFIYGQPLLCVADGRVIEVTDHFPDNQDPAQPRNNNAIRIRHTAADGSLFYSMYLHHKQFSARVRAGEPVFAGQHLADVGNAGISTDPHLHLCIYTYDPWGEFRTLPIFFPMHSGDGSAVEGGTAINGLRFVPAPLARTVP